MNTIDALLTRNSVPRLTTPIPTKDQLEIAYRCALRAPDHAWMRPWKFIQISGKGLDKLSNAFVNTAKKLNENIDGLIHKNDLSWTDSNGDRSLKKYQKGESIKVKILERFFANISMLSFPCFPVKVLAFLVFTNNAFIIFL